MVLCVYQSELVSKVARYKGVAQKLQNARRKLQEEVDQKKRELEQKNRHIEQFNQDIVRYKAQHRETSRHIVIIEAEGERSTNVGNARQ